MGDPGLVGDDLLGAQGDGGALLRGQGQGLVVGVGVEAVCAAEDRRQGLDGHPGDVVQGLLRGEETPAVWAWVRSIQLWGFLAL